MTLTDSALLVGGIMIPTLILSYLAFCVVLAIGVGFFAYYRYQKHKAMKDDEEFRQEILSLTSVPRRV